MMDKELKRKLAKELAEYREADKNVPCKERLNGNPFNLWEAMPNVFSIGYHIHHRTPCKLFGRQLVLKIVDELLE